MILDYLEKLFSNNSEYSNDGNGKLEVLKTIGRIFGFGFCHDFGLNQGNRGFQELKSFID